MTFFNIDNVFFSLAGYPVSYLEFVGLISGLAAITLSARANVWNWPIGVVNVVLSFFLFYQVQLYPDMLLQTFFFATNIIGWWRWLNPAKGEEDKKKQLKVSFLSLRGVLALVILGTTGTFLMGKFSQNLHAFFPTLFNKPGAFPYLDSFIMVMSIITTYYVVQKKIECWIVWILVDLVATFVYFQRDLILYSILYFIYCFIAAYGLYYWLREYRNYRSLPD
jgi:nicotinamide mononucleotide transporter